jgi:hypothetical protein
MQSRCSSHNSPILPPWLLLSDGTQHPSTVLGPYGLLLLPQRSSSQHCCLATSLRLSQRDLFQQLRCCCEHGLALALDSRPVTGEPARTCHRGELLLDQPATTPSDAPCCFDTLQSRTSSTSSCTWSTAQSNESIVPVRSS